MYLVFDTETTGLPIRYDAPLTDFENWPRLVQIAWQLHEDDGSFVQAKNLTVFPDGFDIPYSSAKIHGISTEKAQAEGIPIKDVMSEFLEDVKQTRIQVGHNLRFDLNIVGSEILRLGWENPLEDIPVLDTQLESTEYCAIPGGRGGKFKWPRLNELHSKLFGEEFDEAHNAAADVEATARSFFKLGELKVIELNPPLRSDIMAHLKKIATEILSSVDRREDENEDTDGIEQSTDHFIDHPFAHLHVHSKYSILQATCDINEMVAKAGEDKMPAVALTDLGNMYAAFHFVKAIGNYNKKAKEKAEEKGMDFTPLKGIVGCEFFICRNHTDKSVKDNGFQIPLLAKNKSGYHALAKLSSTAFVDGYYYVPRIDKDVLIGHKENLIALSGGIRGEIPQLVLNIGERQAEEAVLWWKETFQEDFYLELINHGLDEEKHVNSFLIEMAEKHDIKLVAANNVFYLDKENANAHDILLCVKENEKKQTPIGRGRGYRYGFPNDEFYFKSQDEMKAVFHDRPDAIENIQEVVDKIEPFTLARDVLLPEYDIPVEFVDSKDAEDGGKRGEMAYLRHLTYQGAKERYGEISDEIKERLDFELDTIEMTGYPGYFLIVQDFTGKAREMGVDVGPGRGSAAGSAVAYCIGITNVDPIKYNLLFERFLNPDRVSLPDIDIDFDDRGRDKVIQYVIDKYGENQVAQIITYGTMAAKSSIRDTARVLDLSYDEADRLAKLMPDTSLAKLFKPIEEVKKKLSGEDLQKGFQFRDIAEEESPMGDTIRQARVLEGSVRNTGIHACGVIITPDDITNFVPVALAKDTGMYCTQFDNSVVESAGLLKMDFLGLKTLTIIKDAVANIQKRHGVKIIPDDIPLDDEKTYELFQKGNTVGIFQYESTGMQKYLKELKPSVFEDLIAMNALYRPGPLEYIPEFIDRKHGRSEIIYDLDDMEEHLKETYGITVYQEQVMLLSQKLAGFTKGEADMLRKAMGKKIFALLETLKPKFIAGGIERKHDPEVLEKIWKDWEAFASYAFNKSHSTCYAWIAYQTAYLKANYPAEFMSAVLSNNMNDIKSVSLFMEEAKHQKIPVLGPDVNESDYYFTVNKNGAIRFGLGAVKGVGSGAVDIIVKERENGSYQSIFDVTSRVDLRSVNKKTLEGLALAGAFDGFDGSHRGLYFAETEKGTVLELAIRFGNQVQEKENSTQMDIFGEISEMDIQEPVLPEAPEWNRLQALKKEKEVVGIFISGHPLDDFKHEIRFFVNASLADLENEEKIVNKELSLAGIVSKVDHRVNQRGQGWGILTLEDYQDRYDFRFFGEDYQKFKHFMDLNVFLHMKIMVQERTFTDKETGQQRRRTYMNYRSIQLLSDVFKNDERKVELIVPLDHIKDDFADRINHLLSKHAGKQAVKIHVFDREDKDISISLHSRMKRVDISKELIEDLESFEGMGYRLSK